MCDSPFRYIQPDSRVVVDHVREPLFKMTISLRPEGAQTELTFKRRDFGHKPVVRGLTYGFLDKGTRQRVEESVLLDGVIFRV